MNKVTRRRRTICKPLSVRTVRDSLTVKKSGKHPESISFYEISRIRIVKSRQLWCEKTELEDKLEETENVVPDTKTELFCSGITLFTKVSG